MMVTTTELPSFEEPPLSSVQLSVALAGRVRLSDLLRFYDAHLSADFPTLHERAPYEPVREEPWDHATTVTLDLNEAFGIPSSPSVQLHAHTESREWHVQLQQDWLAVTWRRIQGNSYPRWASVRSRFDELLSGPLTGPQNIDQADVTYRNELHPDSVTGVISRSRAAEALGDVESLRLHSHHRVELAGAEGRLHLDIGPSANAERLALTLTARAQPVAGTLAAALEVHDAAHDMIVRGFKAITTSEYHKIWKETT